MERFLSEKRKQKNNNKEPIVLGKVEVLRREKGNS